MGASATAKGQLQDVQELSLTLNAVQKVKTLASALGCSEKRVLEDLIERAIDVISEIRRSRRKILSPEWGRFIEALGAYDEQRSAEEEEKVKRRDREKIRYLNEKLASIDVSKLEKDNKNPSGFKNVYRYSTGYRAMVTRDGKARYLRTRADAVLAAQDRYEWYQRYGLPYGIEEHEVARMVREGMPSDLALANFRHLDDWMTGKGHYNDEALNAHLEEIRIKRAVTEAEEKRGRGRPKKVVDVLARRRGKVTWLDEQRVVVEHDDGTAFSYMPLGKVIVWMGDTVDENGKIGEVYGVNTRVMVHAVPPPSQIREGRKPQLKLTPGMEGSFLEIPTAAERRAAAEAASVHDAGAAPEPAVSDEEARAAKEQLKAIIRQQKIDAAKTPTERESERIEVENEEAEAEKYPAPEPAPQPVLRVVPEPVTPPPAPPRPARPVVKDPFWEED